MHLIPACRKNTLAFATVFFSMLLSMQVYSEPTQQPTIAIIIDDMGNHYQNGLALIELPFPLTLSFLPERQHTKRLSVLAAEHHKEVMLHAPMENILGLSLGKGGLTADMSEKEIKGSLAKSLASIPHAIGMNNHMGSKLTSKPRIMHWVMEELSQHPYYFVDSRTTPKSVAARTAKDHMIPHLSRDVFLDHKQTRKFVQRQFIKLLKIAKKKGTAIAIAHPHSVTIDYLTWALPKLDERGYSIATASSLWQIKHPEKTMFAHRKPSKTSMTLAQKNYSGKAPSGQNTSSIH